MGRKKKDQIKELIPKEKRKEIIQSLKSKADRVRSCRSGKLSMDIIEEITSYVALGVPKSVAAQAAGISPATLSAWERAGRDGTVFGQRGRLFSALKGLMEIAEAECESWHIFNIRTSASDGDWHASKWYLETTRSDRYSQKFRVQIDGELDRIVEILKEGLDPDVFEQVCVVLARAKNPGEA